MSAATPSEWAAAGSLGLSAISVIALAMAFADADAAYFDPRPAVRRAVEPCAFALRLALSQVAKSEAVYLLFCEWDNACHASREAARDAAALLILLTTSPKGALR